MDILTYNIKFDTENSNLVIVRKDGKIITTFCCPPINEGCDIINFSDTLSNGYTYNFDGLIVITSKFERSIYHKGKLMDTTKRKLNITLEQLKKF